MNCRLYLVETDVRTFGTVFHRRALVDEYIVVDAETTCEFDESALTAVIESAGVPPFNYIELFFEGTQLKTDFAYYRIIKASTDDEFVTYSEPQEDELPDESYAKWTLELEALTPENAPLVFMEWGGDD